MEKVSARKVFWHGTSSKNKRSILKKGLDPNPKNLQFDSHSNQGVSIKTYGGVYLADKWSTAHGYATNAKVNQGGDPLMVAVTYETRTPKTLVDEDDLIFILQKVSSLRSPSDLFEYGSWWGALFRENGFKRGYARDLNKPSQGYFLKDLIETAKTSDLEKEFLAQIQKEFPEAENRIKRQEKEVKNFASQVLKDFAMHFLDTYYNNVKKYVEKDLEENLKFYLKDNDEEKIEKTRSELVLSDELVKDLKGSYSRLVSSVDSLSRFLKEIANPRENDDISGNKIRVKTPITFRGKNKILLLAQEIKKKPKEWSERPYASVVDVVILYNKSPQLLKEYIKQYQNHVGGSFRFVDKNGRTLHQEIAPYEEKNPWPTSLWGQKKATYEKVASAYLEKILNVE